MKPDKIFVTAINFNDSDTTIRFLDSLKDQDKEGIDLNALIIDNSTKQKIKINKENYSEYFNLKIIDPQDNLGFSGGHNMAIKEALISGANYVLIMNNDVVLDRKLILEMLKTIKNTETEGIVVPKIYFAKGYEFHKERYKKDDLGKVFWYAGGEIDWKNMISYHRGVDEVDKGQFNKQEETNFATGCCMLVKREVFEKVGLLDENYFLYYEDADFSQRVLAKGYKIIYAPKAILWHENAGSAGGSGSTLQDYFITRNRMYFGFKYAPLRTKIALIKESFLLLLKGRKNQKKGIKDFYFGKMGKGSII